MDWRDYALHTTQTLYIGILALTIYVPSGLVLVLVRIYNLIMPIRKNFLANGQYYHVFVRSIAGYVVFNDDDEYNRMQELINIYKFVDFHIKYSRFKLLNTKSQLQMLKDLESSSEKYVKIASYCIMPTHIHLLLKQESDNGISIYMKKVLQSYSSTFNKIHKRSGPLWASRFKNVLVENDEQLLHLTRYIHLNPTSAGLVESPEDWGYSTCRAYILRDGIDPEIIDMHPEQYKDFVDDRKDYQRQLSRIKSLLIDNYTG